MATKTCPKCATQVPVDANFCTNCRFDLRPDTQQPEMAGGNRWDRQPGDFAARFESSDLKALLSKGLAVQEGTTGLLFQDGAFAGQLEAGRHTAETVSERLLNLVRTSPFSAVLVDSGDVPLSFSGDDVLTRDSQAVAFRVDIAIQLASPNDFYINFMKGQTRSTTSQLHGRVQPLIDQAMRNVIGQCDASELDAVHAELQQRIRDNLESAVDQVLATLGLGLQRVELIQFENEAREQGRRQQAQRSQQLNAEQQRQEFEQKKTEIEQNWKRFQDRLEADEVKSRMAKLETQQEFDDLRVSLEHESKVKGLVQRERWESLWKDYEERKEDRELARNHLLQTLNWERRTALTRLEHDYKLLSLTNSHELSDTERVHRIEQEDEDFRRKLSTEYTQLEETLKREEMKRGFQKKTREEDFTQELSEEERRRAAELQRRKDEAELDKIELDRNLSIYEKKEKIEQEAKERAQALEDKKLDNESHRQNSQLDADHKRQLESSDAAHQQRIGELKQFNEMSCEALIAAAPVDRASMLVELRKSEGLKDMSEEQILAMAAERSPHVAAAIAEKFRSQGSTSEAVRERESELYERMLSEQKASTGQLQAATAQNMDMLKDLMSNAFGTQRDVGIAAATSRSVSNPAGSPPPTQSEPPASNVQVSCSRCGSLNKTGARYCHNCGETF